MYFHSALRAPASSPSRQTFPPPGQRASQPDAALSWGTSSTGRPRPFNFSLNQLAPPSHPFHSSPLASPIRQAVAAEDLAMSSSLCSNAASEASSAVPHSTPPTSAADTTSPSSRRLELGAPPASAPASPAKLSSAKAAQSTRPQQPPATDRLNLPIPPTSLAFVLPGESGSDAPTMQRYTRKGTAYDARAAVVGRGAFGEVMRFERGDVFVASMPAPATPVAAAPHDASLRSGRSSAMEREPVENLTEASQEEAAQLLKRKTSTQSLSTAVARRALHEAAEHDAAASIPRARSVNSASPVTSSVPLPGTAAARSRLPTVIVVKVCRTPTSGSYDEFPRCGPGRAEAKAADVLLSSGRYIDPDQKHTRIVRGELRMFKFLQAAAAAEGISQRHTHLVRLIADVSMAQSCELARLCGDVESADATAAATPQPMAGGPPLPRLLVFERLVDLDVMLTPRGWVKNRGLWTVEQVEGVGREVAAGLKFLHAHCLVHGDLKPANLMRCAKTGVVKLIDLGATRRWIRLPVTAKESSTIVEEVDALIKDGRLSLSDYTSDLVCEGLGSLTGSPHFMAPEVLLQAGRYLSADGYARSVLDDYVSNSTWLPDVPSARWIAQCHDDFKRGWGIQSDVWSWGCCVLALMLRTLPTAQRPSSSTVCPFNFSFDESMDDALEPLWPLDPSEETLPRFHLWARLFPLRIMDTLKAGIELPVWADELSAPVAEMVRAAMRHQDQRPTATAIYKALNRPPPLEQLSVRDNASIFSSNLPSPAASMFSLANSSQADLTSHQSAASSVFAKRLVTLRGPDAPPLPSVPPEVAHDKRVSEPVELAAPATKSRSDTLTHRNTTVPIDSFQVGQLDEERNMSVYEALCPSGSDSRATPAPPLAAILDEASNSEAAAKAARNARRMSSSQALFDKIVPDNIKGLLHGKRSQTALADDDDGAGSSRNGSKPRTRSNTAFRRKPAGSAAPVRSTTPTGGPSAQPSQDDMAVDMRSSFESFGLAHGQSRAGAPPLPRSSTSPRAAHGPSTGAARMSTDSRERASRPVGYTVPPFLKNDPLEPPADDSKKRGNWRRRLTVTKRKNPDA